MLLTLALASQLCLAQSAPSAVRLVPESELRPRLHRIWVPWAITGAATGAIAVGTLVIIAAATHSGLVGMMVGVLGSQVAGVAHLVCAIVAGLQAGENARLRKAAAERPDSPKSAAWLEQPMSLVLRF